jgi:GTPase
VRPFVAIVGRPNVGKSTLFNRLAGRRLAIVHDQPGVTRDRNYGDTLLSGREIMLVDTGGFDPEDEDPMRQGIARQVKTAIAEADVVVCVLDGTAPPTFADREAVKLLRQSEKPVLYVANKADDPARVLVANELYELGIPKLWPVSALHGLGLAELGQAVVKALPALAEKEEPLDDAPHVALIGRPNAGKSSLINRLSGDERSLVDARPGTTRDPVDSRLEFEGNTFLVVDTAGIRKRTRVDGAIEGASVMRAIRSLERAQIVIVVVDASGGVSEQDARLLGLAYERGRAIVVALNKVDLLDRKTRKAAEESVKEALRFAPWAPVISISAKTGFGVSELMKTVKRASEEYQRRVSTAELNRFFETVLAQRSPPTHKGRAPRIFYITQAQSAPPVFVAMSSAPEHIKESYRRFIMNQIRKSFGFECIPIDLKFKGRRRDSK